MGASPISGAAGPLTHYQVLGVQVSASRDTIRQAYREHARRLHPDAGAATGGESREVQSMAVVNAAWEVLGDPVRRQAYDMEIGQSRPAGNWRPLADDDDFNSSGDIDVDIEDLDDWNDRPPRPTRPSDLLVMIPVLVSLSAVGLFFFSAMAGSTKLRAASLGLVPIAILGFVAAPLLTMLRSRSTHQR